MSPQWQFVLDHIPMHLMGSVLVGITGWAAKSLSDLSKNVQSLNVQVARVIEKIDSHERRLILLEKGTKHGQRR